MPSSPNSRCRDIIYLLVSTEQTLSAEFIAKQLKLSPRMVRKSLADAKEWLQGLEVKLIKIPGKGYCLVLSELERKNLNKYIQRYQIFSPLLTAKDRFYILLLNLFSKDQPIQLKQLQQILNISRSTTIKTLDIAEKWLNIRNLELIRRPNFGCIIVGNESNWRNALVEILQESIGEARTIALCQGNNEIFTNSYSSIITEIEKAHQAIWMRLDVPKIKRIMIPFEYKFTGNLSDQRYIGFLLYLAVLIYRNRVDKKEIGSENYISTNEGKQQISESRIISNLIKERFGIQISEFEVYEISRRIPITRERSPLLVTKNEIDNVTVTKLINDAVDQFLAKVSLSLHPSLKTNKELIFNLVNQLELLVVTKQISAPPINPLLLDVKTQYPYIFTVAKNNITYIETGIKRELTEDEIGTIAICIIAAMEGFRLIYKRKKALVVCGAGVITAWLLVSRIQTEFPEMDVVDVIAAHELESRKSLIGIDLIISTISLNIKNIPVIQVSPLLGFDEQKRLKLFLEKHFQEKKPPYTSVVHLSELIRPDTIELGLIANNWEDVIEKSSSKLLQYGYIEPEFILDMKDMIHKHGPYMVFWPGFILLHAHPSGVKKLCMSVVTLQQPVYFGHPQNDPVQVAIVLGAMDNHSHIPALLELHKLLEDEKARLAIQNTMHKSVILHWVSKYSN